MIKFFLPLLLVSAACAQLGLGTNGGLLNLGLLGGNDGAVSSGVSGSRVVITQPNTASVPYVPVGVQQTWQYAQPIYTSGQALGGQLLSNGNNAIATGGQVLAPAVAVGQQNVQTVRTQGVSVGTNVVQGLGGVAQTLQQPAVQTPGVAVDVPVGQTVTNVQTVDVPVRQTVTNVQPVGVPVTLTGAQTNNVLATGRQTVTTNVQTVDVPVRQTVTNVETVGVPVTNNAVLTGTQTLSGVQTLGGSVVSNGRTAASNLVTSGSSFGNGVLVTGRQNVANTVTVVGSQQVPVNTQTITVQQPLQGATVQTSGANVATNTAPSLVGGLLGGTNVADVGVLSGNRANTAGVVTTGAANPSLVGGLLGNTNVANVGVLSNDGNTAGVATNPSLVGGLLGGNTDVVDLGVLSN